MDFLSILLSFLTLCVLEIVLGIDNLVFLAIVSERLPPQQRAQARRIGLSLAWIMRLVLLASAVWLTKLTTPLITVYQLSLSLRDVFLVAGGLFLLAKATQEIFQELEVSKVELQTPTHKKGFRSVILQIVALDLVFSVDSILTAVGLTQRFWIMAAAITVAIIWMLWLSEGLSRFIKTHPSVKMLALSFLILIGVVLIADGFGNPIPRGYLYFGMAYAFFIEALNLLKKRGKQQTPNRR
jgi:predicted tellurium resistance membrane protein TerC